MQYSQEHLKTMVYAKFGGQTECIMGNWKIENWIWCVVFRRFVLFRRCLDAEMKDGVREGLHIKCKKEEKEFVSEQEEATFWCPRKKIICCPIVVVSNDWSGKYTVFSIKTD